jgi:hypothetical protein
MSDKPRSSREISDETMDEIRQQIVHGTGYRRPPKEHQFKKGQSGNPKGRPKVLDRGDRSSHSIALKEAERLVTVREGETVHQITQIDAVHRAQYTSAVRGSAYAQKNIIERYERARRERCREIEARNEIWSAYVDRTREEIAAAEKRGVDISHILPHPDDVVIDPQKGVSFIGPWDDASLARLQETIAWRDMLMIQDIWDVRAGRGEGEHSLTLAGVLALSLNNGVPARHRLDEVGFLMRRSRLEETSKRELSRLLFRSWKRLGIRWTPERRLPSIIAFMRFAAQVRAAIDLLPD